MLKKDCSSHARVDHNDIVHQVKNPVKNKTMKPLQPCTEADTRVRQDVGIANHDLILSGLQQLSTRLNC